MLRILDCFSSYYFDTLLLQFHMSNMCFACYHKLGSISDKACTLIKMEREIFFLGNLFPKYEELVPHYEVNYFFPFLQGKLTLM